MYGQYFQEINTPEKAYVLGLIYADGSVTQDRARLTMGEDADALLQQVAQCIGSKPPRYYKRINGYSDKRCGHLSFAKEATNLYRLLGSHKEHLPLHQIPVGLQSHFMRGIFDGDGCIALDNGYQKERQQVSSVQPGDFYILFCLQEHAYQASNIISSQCNVSAPVPTVKYGNGQTAIYKIRWGGTKQLLRIRQWLYQDASVYLTKKATKFKLVKAANDV